jgi:dihydroneopterin aldolase
MSDRIMIKGLQVAARIGVPDRERAVPQRLEIDAVLEGSFRGLHDDLGRTADYAAAAEWLRKACASVEFRLLESLADHLATGLLQNFPMIAAAEVEIRKFILPTAAHAAVAVRRERD